MHCSTTATACTPTPTTRALTTPRRRACRRAVAIQLIINRELGLNKIQTLQGSFAIEYLTDLVEEASTRSSIAFRSVAGCSRDGDHLPARQDPGGVALLRDQEADGSLPIIGINTFLSGSDAAEEHKGAELIRSTEEEKQDQVAAVRAFQRAMRRARRGAQRAAAGGSRRWHVFAQLMECSRSARWGRSLAAVSGGGQYRRNM